MEEAITEAVLAKVLPALNQLAQVAADVQRLTKLLEAEAVEPAEMSAVLAHSGAVSIEVATAQAASLSRLGYRLVPVPASSAPEPVVATWDGPTPPQAAPAVRVATGENPLWTPPPAAGPDMSLEAIKARGDGVGDVKDKTWTEAFE